MAEREVDPSREYAAGWGRETSPYHPGEMIVQGRAGARDFAERVGRRVIRDYMPDQHREFFGMLPYAFIGSLDERGRPWASVLSGRPGFMHSPDPRSLVVSAFPPRGDPALVNLRPGAPLGLVGVELHTRRRNRLNGRIREVDESRLVLAVDQSFGNCPQYIQARAPDPVAPSLVTRNARKLGSVLDAEASAIVARSDTFFIASASPAAGSDDPAEGVDVNHRGGRPGFVRIETVEGPAVLTAPDFVGNLAFNTLGNIALNPRAGLLFLDFETGDIVTLTGRAEVIWDGPELGDFLGAERLLRVTVDEAHHLPSALPWRWTPPEQARQLAQTGDWRSVAAASRARADERVDRTFRVVRMHDESPTVRSFYLEPADGGGLASYEPGQFLPLAVKPLGDAKPLRRTYSLSQAPRGHHYRISIRREGAGRKGMGVVSNWFHDAVGIGTEILAQAPRGAFRLDRDSGRSVVLIGAGIGVTPLLAMAEYLTGGTEDRLRFPDRPIQLIHAVGNGADHPFREEVRSLARTRDNLAVAVAYSAPRSEDRRGEDYHIAGRLDRSVLRVLLPLDDHDYYLCGPPGFMQTVYEALRSLGAADHRIHFEAFGPASVHRNAPPRAREAVPPPAAPAVPGARIEFAASGAASLWEEGTTLLDLAEAAGIDASWSCRSGSCGTCSTPVLKGRVTYSSTPEFEAPAGEAPICCAMPADAEVTLDL